MDTPRRSEGGVFVRSSGGVLGTFAALTPSKYYFWETPVVTTTINMSDAGSWMPAVPPYAMVTDGGAISLPLYDGVTGAFICTLGRQFTYRPQVQMRDYSFQFARLYPSAPLASCPVFTGSNTVAFAEHIIEHPYLLSAYYPGHALSAHFYTSLFHFGDNFTTNAKLPAIPTIFYTTALPETLTTLPASYYARVGNDFFPHKLVLNVDVDIDSWYTGKFADVSGMSPDGGGANIVRRTKTFTGVEMQVNVGGVPTNIMIYNNCFSKNSTCLLLNSLP